MGYREDEKRWKRIQELLAAEASGKPVRPLVSQRTLFGIPSTVEQTIERIVAEDEAARRARREGGSDSPGSPTAPADADSTVTTTPTDADSAE